MKTTHVIFAAVWLILVLVAERRNQQHWARTNLIIATIWIATA